MKIFDNINNIVKDDLKTTITKNSKLSIAAACFSIYAFEELKEQLKDISEDVLPNSATGSSLLRFGICDTTFNRMRYLPLSTSWRNSMVAYLRIVWD